MNIYGTACDSINLGLCWRVRSFLIAAFSPALLQDFFIPVTFYVQTRSTTAIPLNAWISDGSIWTSVPGGLCGNHEFDANMRKPAQWAVLQIFLKLALNNAGRRAKRVIAHFPPRIDKSMATGQ